jgi:hypothetical protein
MFPCGFFGIQSDAQNHNPNPVVTMETKYSAQSCVISHSLTWELCKVDHYIDVDSFKGSGVLWSNTQLL